jgi:hypothetical protein
MPESLVPEAEVAQTLARLPKTSLLRRYVTHAARCTDAPLLYHVAGGLTILAATAPIDLSFPFGNPIHANLFSLLVGRSRLERKSTAIKLARRIIEAACPQLSTETPGSRDALIESVRAAPKQILFYEEFGDFLASTKDGHLAPIKLLLNDLFDTAPVGRKLVGKGRAPTTGNVRNARVSLIGGITPSYLEDETTTTDWTGGFFSRFCLFYDARERSFSPLGESAERDVLVDEVRRRAENVHPGVCLGFDPDAVRTWAGFAIDTEAKLALASPNAIGPIAGAQGLAIKVALLLSLDCGQAFQNGRPWYVDAPVLDVALDIARWHARCAQAVTAALAMNRAMRERRTLIRALRFDAPQTFRQILHAQNVMLKRRLDEVLDSVRTEGLMQESMNPDMAPQWIRLCDENGFLPGELQRVDLLNPARNPSRRPSLESVYRAVTSPMEPIDGAVVINFPTSEAAAYRLRPEDLAAATVEEEETMEEASLGL